MANTYSTKKKNNDDDNPLKIAIQNRYGTSAKKNSPVSTSKTMGTQKKATSTTTSSTNPLHDAIQKRYGGNVTGQKKTTNTFATTNTAKASGWVSDYNKLSSDFNKYAKSGNYTLDSLHNYRDQFETLRSNPSGLDSATAQGARTSIRNSLDWLDMAEQMLKEQAGVKSQTPSYKQQIDNALATGSAMAMAKQAQQQSAMPTVDPSNPYKLVAPIPDVEARNEERKQKNAVKQYTGIEAQFTPTGQNYGGLQQEYSDALRSGDTRVMANTAEKLAQAATEARKDKRDYDYVLDLEDKAGSLQYLSTPHAAPKYTEDDYLSADENEINARIENLKAERKDNPSKLDRDRITKEISELKSFIKESEKVKKGKEKSGKVTAFEESIRNKPDFDEKSEYVPTDSFTDAYYELVNDFNNMEVRGMLAQQEMLLGTKFTTNDEWEYINDDERRIFNYLYVTEGEAAAMRYLREDINTRLTERQREAEEAEWARYAYEDPWGTSAVSTLAGVPGRAADFVGQLADFAMDGEIDENAYRNTYISNAIREEVPKGYSDVGNFAYQTGMSMADFLYTNLITGGFAYGGEASAAAKAAEWLSLAIMGSGAASNTVVEAKDRGLTDGQAFALGAISGFAEVFTEKISIENLFSAEWEQGILRYLIKNTISEGAEEVGSDFINLFADVLISKDKSEWAQTVQAYEDSGLDERDAFLKAVEDQLFSTAGSFLGGALSGFAMAGGSVSVNLGVNAADYIQGNKQINLWYNNPYETTADSIDAQTELLNAAMQGAAGDAQLESKISKYGDKLSSGQTLNAKELRVLLNSAQNAEQDVNVEPSADIEPTSEALTEAAMQIQAPETQAPVTQATVQAQKSNVNTETDAPEAQSKARLDSGNRAVNKMADSLGEYGNDTARRVYREMGDNVPFSQFATDYLRAYHAGEVSNSFDTFNNYGVLTEAQARSAFDAGNVDAVQNIAAKTEALTKGKVSMFNGNGKMGRVTIKKGAVSANEMQLLNALARYTGADVTYVKESGMFNGYYRGNRIVLAGNADYGVMVAAIHEFTHRLAQTAPKEFQNTLSLVADQYIANGGYESFDAAVKAIQTEYRKAGENISYAGAREEVVANYIMSCVDDTALFKNIVDHDRNLAQKIVDFIRQVFDDIKKFFDKAGGREDALNRFGINKSMADAEKTLDAFQKMINESSENISKMSESDLRDNIAQAQELQQFSRKFVDEHISKLGEKYDVKNAEISLNELQNRYREIVKIWDDIGLELNSAFLNEWNNKVGKDRAFTVFKTQVGYKYNIELSSMCKKGVPLFEAIDTIVQEEIMDRLNTDRIGKEEKEILYDILKKHSFEIPCAICYVEQARQGEGRIISNFLEGDNEGKIGWNEALRDIESRMKKKGVNYTFPSLDRSIATDNYVSRTQEMDVKTQEAFYAALMDAANKEIDNWNEANPKKKQKAHITSVTPQEIKAKFKGTLPANLKLFKTLFTEPQSRMLIDNDLLYSSLTTRNLASAHHDLYGLFNQQGGVSGYKTKQSNVVYWGDILKKNMAPSTVRKEGGIRNQSNSDFQMYTLLDQAQMYIDMSAKGYYLQAYTKTLTELKLFGKSKAKINASLIPAVHIYYNADGTVDVERTQMYAGLDENMNPIYDDIEGIPHEEAFALISDPEYSRNICGICIGYSDEHILRLLDDTRVQMIIGFHDKTDNPDKRYRGARYAHNYNGENEAVDLTAGKTVHVGYNEYLIRAEKMFGKNKASVEFNGKQYAWDDVPKLAADMYLSEYDVAGKFAPAYAQFKDHENYYKLLADYGLYDAEGHYAPHEKVQFNMPAQVPYLVNGVTEQMDTKQYIKQELAKELKVRDSISEALADRSSGGIIPQFIERVNALHDGKKLSLKSDAEYLELAKDPVENASQLREMVERAARNAGFNSPLLYHGTDRFGFTTTDVSKSDDKISFFATDDDAVAGSYTRSGKRRTIDTALSRQEKQVTLTSRGKKLNELLDNLRELKNGIEDEYAIQKYGKALPHDSYGDVHSWEVLAYYVNNPPNKGFDERSFLARLDNLVAETYYQIEADDSYESVEDWLANSKDGVKLSNLISKIASEKEKADVAWKQERQHATQAGIYELYANTDGFLTIDAKGKNWNRITFNPYGRRVYEDVTVEMDGDYIVVSYVENGEDKYVESKDINAPEIAEIIGDSVGERLLRSSEWKEEGYVDLGTIAFNQNGDRVPKSEVVYTTGELARYALDNKYKGVTIKNLVDKGGKGHDGWGASNVYIFLNPQAQVKSADLVTYDDNGNVIPLSERFNPGNEDIRYSLKDSEGNSLTTAQQEYFKDSKVRDENGNLLVMFHGTKASFTVFEKQFIGSTGAFEGSGFNFTPSETRAASYGGNVMRGYVNVTNPLSSAEKTLSVRKLADIIIKADPTGDNIIANYAKDTRDYGTDAFIRREALTAARAIHEYAENDVDIYSDLSAAAGGDVNLMQVFSDMGFDGAIHYYGDGKIQTVVTFDSNQFKNADNQNPTENTDVRYSIKSNLYSAETDFTKPVTTEEFAKKISEENDITKYFPDNLPKEFVKNIRKSEFTKPKLYRGMEAAELDFLIENKYLKSNGDYNFSNQKGQTLFDEDARYSMSYATSFAPNDIAAKHYKDGQPSYLVEIVNHPDLNFYKNDVQESYTYGEVPQEYITRIFEITYDSETNEDYVQDVTESFRDMLPELGAKKDEAIHGLPMFFRDNTTGTLLYAVQGNDGWENGRYISEKMPDIIFGYDTTLATPDMAKYFGVSGNESDLAEVDLIEGTSDSNTRYDVDYSLKSSAASKDAADLAEQNRLMRRQLESNAKTIARLKAETKLGKTITDAEIKKIAKSLIKSFSGTIDQSVLEKDLFDAYTLFIKEMAAGKGEANFENKLKSVATKLLESSAEMQRVWEYDSYYGEMMRDLRSTTIELTRKEANDLGDYNDLRKAYFGKVNLKIAEKSRISEVYSELAERYPGTFDTQRTWNDSDQLQEILDVLDDIYEMKTYNPYMTEQVVEVEPDESGLFLPEDGPVYGRRVVVDKSALESAVAEVYYAFSDMIQRGVTALTPTYADKQKAKLDAAVAAGNRAVAAQAEASKRIAQLAAENETRLREAIAEQAERDEKKLNALKNKYAARTKKGKRKQAAAELRIKIAKRASKLSTMLRNPSVKNHIPEEMRGFVAEALSAINLESAWAYDENGKRRKRKNIGDGVKPVQRTAAFQKLREQYQRILDGSESYDGVVDPAIVRYLDKVEQYADVRVDEMNNEQLEQVYILMCAIDSTVDTVNKLFIAQRAGGVQELADEIIRSTQYKRAKINFTNEGAGKALSWVNRLINIEMLDAYTAFDLLGSGGNALYKALQTGRDTRTTYISKTAKRAQEVIGDTDINKLTKQSYDFTINGQKVTFTVPQIMSLYELNKREQARGHIYGVGIRPDTAVSTNKAKKLAGIAEETAGPVRVTEADVEEIISKLTDEQREMADGLQKIMQGYLADIGNDESMKVYGYKKFTEKNYFPVKVDPDQLVNDTGSVDSNAQPRARSVASWGAAQNVVENAKNGIYVQDIFDVFGRHASEMATYAAYLGAIEDVKRVVNYRVDDSTRISGVVNTVMGRGGMNYINKLIQDISTYSAGEGFGLGQLTANYKAASVAANMRVVLQQPTAYFRAGAVMDWKYLLDPRIYKKDGWKKALKYAPIAQWKDWGYFEINQGRTLRNIIFNSDTAVERAKQKLMAPAGAADSLTWGRIWNACELETSDTTDLQYGTKEYYDAVASRFTDIIDQTQVVDNVLGRSQIMRRSDSLTKMATSYMGEPTKQYNMLYRGIRDLVSTKGNKKTIIKQLGRTTSALVLSQFINAIAQSIWDGVRDDDRDKKYLERLLNKIPENFKENVLPWNNIPYVKDIASIIQGYEADRMDLETIASIVSASKNLTKAINGEGKYTLAGAIANMVAEAGRMFGIPATTLKRDLISITRSIAIEADDYWLQYRLEKALNSIGYSSNRSEFYDIAYKALQGGNQELYDRIRQDMIDNGVKETTFDSAIKSRVKAEGEKVQSGEAVEGNPIADKIKEANDKLKSHPSYDKVWNGASETARDTAIQTIDGKASGTYTTSWTEKMENAEAVMDDTQYILYKLALSMVDQPQGEKGHGNISQDEFREAAGVIGLTDKQGKWLWTNDRGWSEKTYK